MSAHDHSDENHVHVSPVWLNILVLAALLGLTYATVETAKMDLGMFDTPVALVIAFTKTFLVILFFMHVKWASQHVFVLAFSAFFFLIFLFGFSFSDYLTRHPEKPWAGYTYPGAGYRTGRITRFPVLGPKDAHHGDHGAHGDAHDSHKKADGHAKDHADHGKDSHEPKKADDHGHH